MNCEQAENLFDAYLNGELSQSLRTELAAHRMQCPQCRHELALMEVTGHVIAAGADEHPSLDDEFTDRLLSCIDRPGRASAPAWHRRLWVGGSVFAAAAALVITFTLLLNRPERHVLGERAVNPSPPAPQSAGSVDESIDLATHSLVQQVENTWTTRADGARWLLDSGQLMILQVLHQFGVDEAAKPAAFEPLPDSFDELAPSPSADDDIEDL
jgi:hypothetical protein